MSERMMVRSNAFTGSELVVSGISKAPATAVTAPGCGRNLDERPDMTDNSAFGDTQCTPCHTSPLEPEHYCSECGAYNPNEAAYG